MYEKTLVRTAQYAMKVLFDKINRRFKFTVVSVIKTT